MRDFFRKPAGYIVIGIMLGLLLAPVAAQAGGTINKLFRQLRPKMDARYVEQTQEAYAFVERSTPPVLIASRTKGFTAVTRPAIGLYCLTPSGGVDIDDRVFVASPEYQNSSVSKADIFWSVTDNNSDCPDGLLEIHTFVDGANSSGIAFSVYSPPN